MKICCQRASTSKCARANKTDRTVVKTTRVDRFNVVTFYFVISQDSGETACMILYPNPAAPLTKLQRPNKSTCKMFNTCLRTVFNFYVTIQSSRGKTELWCFLLLKQHRRFTAINFGNRGESLELYFTL